MGVASNLYKLARTIGKAASKANDIEAILSGNPQKIVNRTITKGLFKVQDKAMKKLTRKLKIK